jgi:hypothetical protein
MVTSNNLPDIIKVIGIADIIKESEAQTLLTFYENS